MSRDHQVADPAVPRRRTAMVAAAALLAGLLVPLALATPASAAGTKVAICHATKSHTNPYRRITVAQSAVQRHKNHHGARAVWRTGITTRWDDIIPDGSTGYDGSNGSDLSWTAAGIAIYDGVTKAASGRSACKAMTAKQYYDSELAAGVSQADVLADLNDQGANEDAALRASLGGSFTIANVGQLGIIGARTTGAGPVGQTTATVRGSVSLGRDAVSTSTAEVAALSFRYGTDADLAGATPVTASPSTATGSTTGIVSTNASAALVGLTSGTTYYYRLVAVTDDGLASHATFEGEILSFVAGAAAPAPPTAPQLTSSAPVDVVQSAAVAVPDGGSFSLLDGAGGPVSTITHAGVGAYTQTATTVVFTPATSYAGAVPAAGLRVTDVHGQSATGTYTPSITALPAAPAPAPLTSTGVGTAVHQQTIPVPSGGSVALLDGSTPVATMDVSGVGGYALHPTTGVLTFAPVAGYAGTPASVGYRVTDASARSGSSTYTPTVTKPAPPAPLALTSTGVLTAVQTAPAVLPAGSSLLVDGVPVTTSTVSGQGSYDLSPSTGTLTFTPVAAFTGAATPVTYQVTDGYSQTGTSTYTPTVLPAAPTAPAVSSTGEEGSSQGVTLAVPPGGAITLLGGATATTLTVPGQGSYLLDPSSGVLVFTPAPGFTGRPTPAGYQVSDQHGRTASGLYSPDVLPVPVVTPVPDPVRLPPAPGDATSPTPPRTPPPSPVVAPPPTPTTPPTGTLPAPVPGPARTPVVPPAVVRDTPRTGLVPVPSVLPRDGAASVQRRTLQTTRSAQGLVAPESSTLGTGGLRAGQATTLPGRFLFDFDSPKLTPRGRQIVKDLVTNLRGTQAVHCEGYTDYAGDQRHEMTLSQQRSVAVCSALKTYGAKVTTTTTGYAGSKPVLVGGKARERHENRRVVVVVRA